jgi:hypothetical protein
MHDLVRLLARTERQKITEVALSFPAPGIPKTQGSDQRVGQNGPKPEPGFKGLVRSLVALTDEEGAHSAGPSAAESFVFRGARYGGRFQMQQRV